DELQELALAHHGVTQVETGKFNLAWQGSPQIEVLQDPIVERPMNLELQCANAVGNPFQVIAEAMGVIIHRIKAPAVPRPVMCSMSNAIERRISQMNIR